MLTAGVNSGDRRAIYHLIRALRRRRVLEIGTNVGASTLHIAAAMKRNDEDSEGECELVTVDIADVNDDSDAYWKRGGCRVRRGSTQA
jgi:predicted O-methyltransferase YrrM